MGRHGLNGRLQRLEDGVAGAVDLAGEAARYGTLLWSMAGRRCYGWQGPQGAVITVTGSNGTLAYEVLGVAFDQL